jgi:hypothetical protein
VFLRDVRRTGGELGVGLGVGPELGVGSGVGMGAAVLVGLDAG